MELEEIKSKKEKLEKRWRKLSKKITFLQQRCRHSSREKFIRGGIRGVDFGDERCLDCLKTWINFGGYFVESVYTPSIKTGFYKSDRVKKECAELGQIEEELLEEWRYLTKECKHPANELDDSYGSCRDTRCSVCGAIWHESCGLDDNYRLFP